MYSINPMITIFLNQSTCCTHAHTLVHLTIALMYSMHIRTCSIISVCTHSTLNIAHSKNICIA